jgi:nitrate reductase gamma subunit
VSQSADLFVWLVLPYASMVTFAVGHVWRYRHDKLGWTSRSTQLLENRMLPWGSVLFHYGALAVIAGHVLGILIPKRAIGAVGIGERAYHHLAGVAGSIAGLVCLIGLLVLALRRVVNRRVRVTTSPADVLVYLLLAGLILLGEGQTLGYNVFGPGYDYRVTVGPWFRDLFFDPQPSLMTRAPIAYQVHAALPWLLFALWPFSRLVHAWSYPFQYLGRPYILYRRRLTAASNAGRSAS